MLFNKLRDTNLKSLRFGQDLPGGGTSNEYIASNPSPIALQKVPAFADAANEQKNRISNLLNNTRRGIKFVTNQQGLQLSNTRLETLKFSSSFVSSINQRLRITPAALYNKNNTINQSGALLGEHLDRFDFTSAMSDGIKYSNIVAKNNETPSGKGNRLFDLSVSLGVGRNPETAVSRFRQGVRQVISGITSTLNTVTRIANVFGNNPVLNNINNRANQIGGALDRILSPTIDQYLGGPNSTNGIGITTIRRFDYTVNQSKTNRLEGIVRTKLLNLKLEYDSGNNSTERIAYQQAGRAYQLATNPIPGISPITIDHVSISKSPVANDFTKLRDQNDRSFKSYLNAEVVVGPNNVSYSYKTESTSPIKTRTTIVDKNGYSHLGVKFNEWGRLDQFDRDDGENMSIVFQLIDPFEGTNLHRIVFPAYISNFKVNSDASWNDISYIGRSENLYTFNKFKRQVAFGFQIPCFNIIQLRERHRALGALESSLAGKYNGNKLGGIMTRLYFGNYFKGETGIINNISYDIPLESSWDIHEKLAHNINVSVNFTVVGNLKPEYKRAGGFFNSIPNGAHYFISSEEALKNTGVTSDAFNKNIPTKYSETFRQSNNVALSGTNAPEPADANDGILPVLPPKQPVVVPITGINHETVGASNILQQELAAKQEVEQAIAAENTQSQLDAQARTTREFNNNLINSIIPQY